MIGKIVTHYKILEKLGEGGMGEVYLAEDTKLKRNVALKFLPSELTRDPEAKRRFVHEAQAASALDHNNICTIYEIDETEEGLMFIAMACYDGETLKQKIEGGPLPFEVAIDLAIQIAHGLAKAHGKEIVHRDIKPGNVIVTTDRVVKILDFGLAKLAGQTKLTKEGATLGTVAYMSPEQAHGIDVDHRTDIWALGAVVYEMVTGQQPFKGDYEQAVVYSIVNEAPQPMTGLRTGVPIELERIVNKCLTKEPSERYQHADELIVDLARLQKESKATVTPSSEPLRRANYKKRVKSLAMPAILAIATLTIAGYFFLNRESETQERIPIAVVDFLNETEETQLNGLSGMLITALEQSRRLSVLTRSRMFDILKQLGKGDVDRIDETLGREICQQANVKAMVFASIRKFGTLYAIDLKVLDPQKNEHLFTANEEGAGQASIPSLIDKLSEKTRRGLKEQADEIQSASQEIAAVTTINLEAYQHYFKGEELINKVKFKEAEEELKKAISLDTTFALAHYRLAYVFSWETDERAKEPIRKAMQYLDKAPEKEQYLIRALNASIKGNHGEALTIHHELLKLYPEEKEALYQIGDWSFHILDFMTARSYLDKVLAMDPTFERAVLHVSWTYRALGQYDKMLDYIKQFVAKTPASEEAYDLLGEAYTLLGDLDNALLTYNHALALFPKSTRPIKGIGNTYVLKNEYRKAEAELAKLSQESRPLSDKREGFRMLGWLYAYLGKYRETLKMIDKIIDIDLNLRDKNDLARSYAEKASWFLVGWHDVENAKRAIAKGLETKAANWYFKWTLAQTYLKMDEYEKAWSVRWRSQFTDEGDIFIRASIQRAKGKYDDAIEDFKKVMQQAGFSFEKVLLRYELAQCYFERGQNERAIEVLQAMLRTSTTYNYLGVRAEVYPKSLYLLGKIYEKKGDKQLAIESYEKLLDLWKDADEDLPELIDAKVQLAKLRGVTKK